MDRHVRISHDESTPLMPTSPSANSLDSGQAAEEAYKRNSLMGRSAADAAETLSMRLLAIPEDDLDAEDRILRESLELGSDIMGLQTKAFEVTQKKAAEAEAWERLCTMSTLSVLAFAVMGVALYLGVEFVGPPNQPVGPYRLLERQEGEDFFDYYSFYEGRDSVGSNGYNKYISKANALNLGIINVTVEEDSPDVFGRRRLDSNTSRYRKQTLTESFVYMGSAPTRSGPRDSIRLQGKRRFNRGLFIIDLRHMPAGCGVWPAFWLTDEPNWPVNGEIDIVEGVNYQDTAKTALHSTQGCVMDDIPQGVSTGGWDTAVGIPDRKTGIPDMTMRYATNCFVYDPHQWLNQGCVAVDTKGNGTLGVPLNKKGGGVYALEWDPINKRMRTWVFTPHTEVPDNLRDSMETASHPIEDRVIPDPDLWPLPYGYYAIGEGTNCPGEHFRNMHLVFNLAFCGSVAGNRYFMDCPKQFEEIKTCNEWIKSEPDELSEAYWKIRGVYVYERAWERAWL